MDDAFQQTVGTGYVEMSMGNRVEKIQRGVRGWAWTLFLLGVDAVMLSGGASTEEEINKVAFIISMAGSAFLCVFGEWIVRRRYHAVKVSKVAGGEKLEQIFSEVQAEAAKVTPFFKIWPAEIYVVPGQEINAFAVGSSTVMITEGALQLDVEYQKALLARELGHLAAGHGCMSLMIAANILFLSVGYLVMQFIVAVMAMVRFLVGSQSCSIVETVTQAHNSLLNMYVSALQQVVAKMKRRCEYDADWFAERCGYGRLLRQALMECAAQKQEKGLFLNIPLKWLF